MLFRLPYACSRALRWLPVLLTLALFWVVLQQSRTRAYRGAFPQRMLSRKQMEAIAKGGDDVDDCHRPQSLEVDTLTVYVITPTHERSTQRPDITRVAHALMLNPHIHWIVIEDRNDTSAWLLNYLQSSGISFTLLHCQGVESPEDSVVGSWKLRKPRKNAPKKFQFGPGKGVVQRNCGLAWIKRAKIEDGVIYFADDDNTYDHRLFREIQTTRRVSVFPVGHFSGTGVSAPVVRNGHVVGFLDPWHGSAAGKIYLDMAAFAVSIQLWAKMNQPNLGGGQGMLETKFLKKLKVKKADLEPKAQNCSQILVWHTHTRAIEVLASKWKTSMLQFSDDTNLKSLYSQMHFTGSIVSTSNKTILNTTRQDIEP